MFKNLERIQLNPVKSTITLGIPIMVLLILDTLYSVVDTYWIGGLGFSAIAALGYIANVAYTSNKIGDGIGRAVNVLISNGLGAENYENANNIAIHGLIIILLIAVVVPPISVPFIKYICHVSNIGIYADLIYDFLALPISFIMFFMLSNFFAAVMGGEGDTKRATVIIVVGDVINMILDPIFIFNMKMGMFGAGLATTVGFLVSFLLFIYLFFYKNDTIIKINFKEFKWNWSIFKSIIKLALPIILTGLIIAIVGVLVNYGLHNYASVHAVAAYVIMLKVQSTAYSPIQGLAKGLCIVVGHLNGAKKCFVLRDTVRKVLLINIGYSLLLGFLLIFFYDFVLSFFTTDANVMTFARNFIMIPLISLVNFAIILPCNYVFIGIEKSNYSFYFLIINIAIIIMLMFIFTNIFHLSGFGVLFAVVIGDAIQAISMLLVLRFKITPDVNNDLPDGG